MAADLTTTNLFLGIMAVVSLLQAISIVAAFAAGIIVVRHVLRVLDGLETRQVAPAAARVNAILDDVKQVTSTLRQETSRVDRLLEWLLEKLGSRRRASEHATPPRVM